MNIIISLFLISVFWVLALDVVDFTETIKAKIARLLNTKGNISLKPFDCSTCMSWWSGLLYLILSGHFTLLNVVVALLFACTTNITLAMYRTIENILFKIINKLN